ncbi:MAG: peptidylprolyl isomerase [Candidatus Kuenenbacteria bacterium]
MKLDFKFFILIIVICFLLGIFILLFLQQPIKDNSQNNEIMNNNIMDNKILNNETTDNKTKASQIKNMSHIITIKTNMGEIRFATYDEDAPKAVNNFITLVQKKFYDGTIFHRVIDGFMIQGGDPEGVGTGGPGYTFEDELNSQTDSYKEGYKKGVVAMANAGPNTNGSQFFIMVADYPLQNNYTIFGKVIFGQDVADAIAKSKTGPNDRPVSPVIMQKITVSEFNRN